MIKIKIKSIMSKTRFVPQNTDGTACDVKQSQRLNDELAYLVLVLQCLAQVFIFLRIH